MKNPTGSRLLRSAVSTVIATTLGMSAGMPVHAQDAVDTSAITAQDLLKLLIDEGVIDQGKVKALTEKLKNRQRATAGAAVESTSLQSKDVKPAGEAGVVRVPYVPKYIKDEIRDQVRIGLKEDVSRDVMAQAKLERWGLPGALPEWVNRVKFSGDMRVREESVFFAPGNVQGDYFDMNYINSKGRWVSSDPREILNTTEDRNRLRARFRLGMKAKVNDRFDVGARLVTGNSSDPVSTNQTQGTYAQKWQSSFDLAYLRYTSYEKQLIVNAGRIENPFFGSDLVWDSDLTFEGVAASYWWMRSSGIMDEFRSFDPFVTVGVFPIGEVERSSEDKWLYAAQTGFQYEFSSQSRLTAALAYYSYDNIVGERNPIQDGTDFDYTAPAFMQKGNTLFDIRNTATTTPPLPALFALASDYDLANFYVEYDIANFAPIHVIVAADYVKNLGFDTGEVAARVGTEINERVEGYQARVTIGWPQVAKARDWQVSMIYRYLERDAVLDAFTDSDFHGGGTDADGYIIKFDYGLYDNVAMTLRWLSSNEVDGDSYPMTLGSGKLGIDTLQVDLNAKF